MADDGAGVFPRTRNDIEVGAQLVRALVHQACRKEAAPLDFPGLLELGRLLDPKDAAMDRAEVLGVQAKLAFVSAFCAANGFPDLAVLARQPGAGAAPLDPGTRAVLAAFDWGAVPQRLAEFAAAETAKVPARLKPRKERPAEVAWYAYFTAHREACKEVASADKREIVNLVMAGLDPETALRRFKAAKAAYAATQANAGGA